MRFLGFAAYSYPRTRVILPRCAVCQGDMRYIIQVASEHRFVPLYVQQGTGMGMGLCL